MHVWKLFERESGDPMFDQGWKSHGPHRQSERNNPMMNEHGKSDSVIVAKKSANKNGLADSTLAEQMEPSALTEGNKRQGNTCQTQGWESVQNSLRLVHQKAKENKKTRFTALMHHICNIETLRFAFSKIKRDAAPGVDQQTWAAYRDELEGNLQNLSDRLKRSAYRAKTVRRVYIPKPNGKQRPLGVTALEDKIVQRATVEVLNAIYEADFVGFSYGFRPKRSQHKALDALYAGILTRKVNWVLDADIRDFFSSISHEWLVKFIEHRIADKRVVRLIQKWLAAGVLEDGQVTYETEGAPQGGSASPLMSNVYLHYVYDLWVQQWRQRQAHGDVIVVRYADDTIVGFEHKSDAEQFLHDLKERFTKFGMELHPEKTRLIEFGRFAARDRERRATGKPETFTFLGLTHISGQTRDKKFTVQRKTIKKRLRAKVKEVKLELIKRRHEPIREVGKWLKQVLTGHYQYYGVVGNYQSMDIFRRRICRLWQMTLSRRSQKGGITWERMNTIVSRWLPKPRICHPHPMEHFGVRTRGKSPVR
jgi:group II intron reverse transcriptase/maturase